MEELKVKNINCPSCNHYIEYWTKNNYIECINCKDMIEVEPCEDVITDIDIIEEETIEENIDGE